MLYEAIFHATCVATKLQDKLSGLSRNGPQTSCYLGVMVPCISPVKRRLARCEWRKFFSASVPQIHAHSKRPESSISWAPRFLYSIKQSLDRLVSWISCCVFLPPTSPTAWHDWLILWGCASHCFLRWLTRYFYFSRVSISVIPVMLLKSGLSRKSQRKKLRG